MTKIKNLDLEVLNIINKSIDEVNKLNKKYKLSKKKKFYVNWNLK